MSKKSTSAAPPQFRQGDVFIERVDAIPADAKDVTTVDRVVLAYGEVTGHAHAVYESQTQAAPSGKARLWDAGAERFLQIVSSVSPVIRGEIVDRDELRLRIAVDPSVARNGFVKCLISDVIEVEGGVQPVANYALLQHEEHDAHLLLNGVYRHRAPQREYAPEGLRNVAD